MADGARLVVGDDRSAGSQAAWDWVAAQDWDGWDVDVVTVEPVDLQHPVDPDGAVLRPWQPEAQRTLPGSGPDRRPVVRHLRAVGDPRAILLTVPAELLVVGRRGRGVLKALHLGSTSDWLLHGPPCPLVMVSEARPVRRALVCADGSDAALVAVRAFARLPLAAETDVEVLSVADGRTDPEAAARTALGVLVDAGVTARVAARTGETGDPREVIIDVAAQSGADLIVLGTRGVGISLLRRLLGGSVASYLCHHAPCSVLVADVPAAAGS